MDNHFSIRLIGRTGTALPLHDWESGKLLDFESAKSKLLTAKKLFPQADIRIFDHVKKGYVVIPLTDTQEDTIKI